MKATIREEAPGEVKIQLDCELPIEVDALARLLGGPVDIASRVVPETNALVGLVLTRRIADEQR